MTTVQDTLKRAMALVNQDKSEEARALVRPLVRDATTRPFALMVMAGASEREGDAATAVYLYRQAVGLAPGKKDWQARLDRCEAVLKELSDGEGKVPEDLADDGHPACGACGLARRETAAAKAALTECPWCGEALVAPPPKAESEDDLAFDLGDLDDGELSAAAPGVVATDAQQKGDMGSAAKAILGGALGKIKDLAESEQVAKMKEKASGAAQQAKTRAQEAIQSDAVQNAKHKIAEKAQEAGRDIKERNARAEEDGDQRKWHDRWIVLGSLVALTMFAVITDPDSVGFMMLLSAPLFFALWKTSLLAKSHKVGAGVTVLAICLVAAPWLHDSMRDRRWAKESAESDAEREREAAEMDARFDKEFARALSLADRSPALAAQVIADALTELPKDDWQRGEDHYRQRLSERAAELDGEEMDRFNVVMARVPPLVRAWKVEAAREQIESARKLAESDRRLREAIDRDDALERRRDAEKSGRTTYGAARSPSQGGFKSSYNDGDFSGNSQINADGSMSGEFKSDDFSGRSHINADGSGEAEYEIDGQKVKVKIGPDGSVRYE